MNTYGYSENPFWKRVEILVTYFASKPGLHIDYKTNIIY